MSKESDLRAMREARFNARPAGSSARKTPILSLVRPATDDAIAPAPAETTDGLCGHRSMNGRSCTREQGHAAKSHRYS